MIEILRKKLIERNSRNKSVFNFRELNQAQPSGVVPIFN